MKKIIFFSVLACIAVFAISATAQETLSVRTRVSSISGNSASVFIDGWPAARGGESYTLVRTNAATGQKVTLNVGTQSSWRDNNVPTGSTYTYKIIRKDGGGAENGISPESGGLNLSVLPGSIMKGVGWGAMSEAGIGWVSVNNETQEPGKPRHSNIPYGVFADSDRLMHGVMWAAHDSGAKQGYGWLSFNREDLEGCPGGACEARLSPNGQITGWAKFLNAEAIDSWGGWVNLRGTTVDGKGYGLCFGDPSGGTVDVGDIRVYVGEGCAGNGGTNHPVLTGAAWAGDRIGGWLLFSTSSANITVSSTLPFGIDPRGPHKIAIRDWKEFSANLSASWFIANIKGGNSTYGTILPADSEGGATVRYTAPNALPFPANTTLRASSTEPTEGPGVVTDTINIVRPYDLVCLSEGQTSIRLIITKNYRSSNYPLHTVYVRGSKSTPPGTVIAENQNGMNSFADTDLDEKTVYYYELETRFSNDGYSIRTPVVSCKTGETPAPIAAVTGMNAYANSPSSIIVNWRDNSKGTDPYEFAIQRMKVTPHRTYTLSFEAKGSTSVDISWTNPTTWVPYTQEMLRSDDGGNNYSPVPMAVGQTPPNWTEENPPTGPKNYVFRDPTVENGKEYKYKVKVCGALNLRDVYSSPVKGGTEKPEIVCVESEPANYPHRWTGGEEEQASAAEELKNLGVYALASVQDIFEFSLDTVLSVSEKIADIFRAGVNKIASTFTDKVVFAEEPAYDAYYRSAAVTKNPAFVDTELDADTVYLYRVSVLSNNPMWSNLRAAKTLKDDRGGAIENRPVCMRNSFCDASVNGLQSGDLVESSEQQCVQNRDCANVGRSDLGIQER